MTFSILPAANQRPSGLKATVLTLPLPLEVLQLTPGRDIPEFDIAVYGAGG